MQFEESLYIHQLLTLVILVFRDNYFEILNLKKIMDYS